MGADRLKKLAKSIDALAEKDAALVREAERIAVLRGKAAVELYGVCGGFVKELNSLVSVVQVELAPPEYSEDRFRDPGVNLIQINAKGRVVQVEFEATDTLTSTEMHRTPYILRGAVRWFNQELLDRVDIREHHLFYCLEKTAKQWRSVDPQSQRIIAFNQDYLIGVMEKLV